METIVLSDDEEDAAPRTGLCIHCGQVSKPHACPHGTVKIMKPLSKSKWFSPFGIRFARVFVLVVNLLLQIKMQP